MKRFVGLALCCSALFAAEPDWRFADPNSAMLASVKVKSLVNSPGLQQAIKQISSQFAGQVPGITSANWQSAQSLMNSVDRIYMSIRSTSDPKQPQMLMLMTGNMQDPGLQSLLRSESSKTMRMHVIDDGSILLGDTYSLPSAVKRLSGTAPLSSVMVRNAGAWASRYDIWFMGVPALMPQTAMPARAAGQPDMSQMIRTFSLGMNIGSDVRMDIVLDTTGPQIARQMAAMARNAQAQQARTQFGDLTRNLRVDVDGNIVRMSISLDPSRFGALAAAPAATATPSPEIANPNSKPNRVVISGLDDGPKEIKLDDKPNH